MSAECNTLDQAALGVVVVATDKYLHNDFS